MRAILCLKLPRMPYCPAMFASSKSPLALRLWLVKAGKYKFADYPKFGGPMTVLAGIVTGVTTYYIIPLTSP